MAEALRFAETICENAPIAVRESLGIARRAYDLPDDALRQLSEQAAQRIRLTDDFQEGPRAFIEKRQPRWRGQ
jgi:enoyl-CoA hydratase/carnithine racemase